jgi:4'-phosphopantetheinyl transferase
VDDFHFNISHSGDWVVCAVDNLPVGIDVEKIHDVDLNLSARFFSEEEHKYLLSLEISKRRNSFFELWTLKESYIKADGRGLSIPLNSFSFKFANKDIVFTTTNQFNECYFKQYDIDTSYKLAVCSSKSDFPKELTDISFDSIYSLVKEHLEKLEI